MHTKSTFFCSRQHFCFQLPWIINLDFFRVSKCVLWDNNRNYRRDVKLALLSLCPQLLYQKGIKKPREAWLGLMSACNPKQIFCFYVILSDIFSLLSTKRSSLFQGINHSLILWHSKFLLSICTSLLGRETRFLCRFCNH